MWTDGIALNGRVCEFVTPHGKWPCVMAEEENFVMWVLNVRVGGWWHGGEGRGYEGDIRWCM